MVLGGSATVLIFLDNPCLSLCQQLSSFVKSSSLLSINHHRCQSSSLLSIIIVVVLSVERRLVLSAQDNVQLREEVAAALEQLRHRSVGMVVVVVVVPLPFFIVVENV